MTGAGSRRKGHNYERELVRKFREAMPGAEVRRGLQYRDGSECADVVTPIYHVEAKRGRKPNIRAALEQAERDAADGMIPVAVVRDDRKRALVAIGLDDFLELVRENWEMNRR